MRRACQPAPVPETPAGSEKSERSEHDSMGSFGLLCRGTSRDRIRAAVCNARGGPRSNGASLPGKAGADPRDHVLVAVCTGWPPRRTTPEADRASYGSELCTGGAWSGRAPHGRWGWGDGVEGPKDAVRTERARGGCHSSSSVWAPGGRRRVQQYSNEGIPRARRFRGRIRQRVTGSSADPERWGHAAC